MSKRHDVLAAAMGLFSRQGFRKTSMAEIARHAHVAKPTIYAYFDSKEALYGAVCAHVGEQMLAEAGAAASADAALADRVTGVLSAKFTRTWELLDSSPFAHELLHAQNASTRETVQAATARLRSLLVSVIDEAVADGQLDLGRLDLTADGLADQLVLVGHGAGYGATSAEEQRKNLARLVETVLRAARRQA